MATDMDYIKNCVFIDESAFDINMRSSRGRSIRNTPAVVETPFTRVESHTILGAISSVSAVNIEVRTVQMRKKVKVSGARKRKTTSTKTKSSKTGIRTGHYLEFLRRNIKSTG